jgi:hypothetical protein
MIASNFTGHLTNIYTHIVALQVNVRTVEQKKGWPWPSNGTVNRFPQQQINTSQQRNQGNNVFYVVHAEAIYEG